MINKGAKKEEAKKHSYQTTMLSSSYRYIDMLEVKMLIWWKIEKADCTINNDMFFQNNNNHNNNNDMLMV